MDQRFKTELINPNGENNNNSGVIDWNSDFLGFGLNVGTQYEVWIFSCLKAFAKASGALVVGEFENKNEQSLKNGQNQQITRLTLRDDEECQILPGYHLQAGLAYQLNFFGVNSSFRVGWDFVKWYNVANPRTFAGRNLNSEVSIATSKSTTTYGFHGVLVGLNIEF